MLDLLRRREMSPAGRQIGNARHVRESDDAAVVETDALLARLLERRACHSRTHVVDVGCRGKRPVSRACEESGFPRSSAEHRHCARCSGFPVLLQAISFEDCVLARARETRLFSSGQAGPFARFPLAMRLLPLDPTTHGARKPLILLVGVRGFEPPAPASRKQCSTRLSYTPPTQREL